MGVNLEQALLKRVIVARTLRPCDFTADQNLCKGANIAFAKYARTMPIELSYAAARPRDRCKKLRCDSIAPRDSQRRDGVLDSNGSIVPPEGDQRADVHCKSQQSGSVRRVRIKGVPDSIGWTLETASWLRVNYSLS